MLKINYGILLLFLLVGASFELYILFVPFHKDSLQFTDVLAFGAPAVCGILALVVSSKYEPWTPRRFAYSSLGIGYFAAAIGEATYIILQVYFNFNPYPSIADVFLFAFYPFTAYFLVRRITQFMKFQLKDWIIISAIISAVVASYLLLTLDALSAPNFDFWYGIIFVSGSGTVLAFAIIGALKYKASIFGRIWIIICMGLIVNAVADIWYYDIEASVGYTPLETVDMLWLISRMLVAYALLKQNKEL